MRGWLVVVAVVCAAQAVALTVPAPNGGVAVLPAHTNPSSDPGKTHHAARTFSKLASSHTHVLESEPPTNATNTAPNASAVVGKDDVPLVPGANTSAEARGAPTDQEHSTDKEDNALVTVVVMNFNRPQQLRTEILPAYQSSPLVKEVLVSHGKRDTAFTTPGLTKVRHFADWDNNNELGLMLRFTTAMHATTNAVLFTDDDVVVHDGALARLLEHWREAPFVVHGVSGRVAKRTKNSHEKYAPALIQVGDQDTLAPTDTLLQAAFGTAEPASEFQEVLLVLTSCAVAHRKLAEYVLQQKRYFDHFMTEHSRPLWNGEDILLGISSVHFNRIHGQPEARWFPRAYPQLDRFVGRVGKQEQAISGGSGHADFRTKAMREMLAFYEGKGTDYNRARRVG